MSYFINKQKILPEVYFQASRSSGAGGQHVNKANTKIELRFNIKDSQYLTEQQKATLLKRLNHKIASKGDIIITSEASRSQYKNKEDCIYKFIYLIEHALMPRKKRIATKPTYKSGKQRLASKRKHSEKKQLRKNVF